MGWISSNPTTAAPFIWVHNFIFVDVHYIMTSEILPDHLFSFNFLKKPFILHCSPQQGSKVVYNISYFSSFYPHHNFIRQVRLRLCLCTRAEWGFKAGPSRSYSGFLATKPWWLFLRRRLFARNHVPWSSPKIYSCIQPQVERESILLISWSALCN